MPKIPAPKKHRVARAPKDDEPRGVRVEWDADGRERVSVAARKRPRAVRDNPPDTLAERAAFDRGRARGAEDAARAIVGGLAFGVLAFLEHAARPATPAPADAPPGLFTCGVCFAHVRGGDGPDHRFGCRRYKPSAQ